MAWVRIDDGAMTHPKIVGLSDKAFRLWVWGLSYSQRHLTDGAISVVAIPARVARATADLVKVNLWESRPSGYQVHDYLDWNDSRALVNSRQVASKTRKSEWADRRRARRVPNTTPERVPNTIVGTDNQTKPNQTKEEQEHKSAHASESDNPVAVFIERTYPEIYAKVRHGAAFKVNQARDFEPCVQLVETYGERLSLILEYFLHLPPGKDVLNQPGTPRQLLHMAPMCDAELRAAGR